MGENKILEEKGLAKERGENPNEQESAYTKSAPKDALTQPKEIHGQHRSPSYGHKKGAGGGKE